MSRVGIVGAGFQGRGVGYRLALGGHEVVLQDVSAAQLEAALGSMKSKRARALVSTATSLEGLATCDLVIENVPESLDLKREVLRAVSRVVAPGAVLASNSSSFTPDELAEGLVDPSRFLDIHFLGPSFGNDVLEIVRGTATSDAAFARARELLISAGLDPVEVRPCRAFVMNRVANAGISALGRAVDLGMIDPERFVSYALIAGHARRQLDVLDHIGLDIVVSVMRSCHAAYGARFTPPRWLEALVDSGRFGVKSGRGILDHAGGPVVLRDVPLASGVRPVTPFRTILVRDPSWASSRFLSALLGRVDRTLIMAPADRASFLALLSPDEAAVVAGRVVAEGAPDLVLDCAIGGTGARAREVPEGVPYAVLSPIGAASAHGDGAGVIGALPGYGTCTEVVSRPGSERFEALVLEALGRVIRTGDGPIRPLALLAFPRLFEARRVVEEGVADRASVARIMAGEDPIAEAERYGASAMAEVERVLSRL